MVIVTNLKPVIREDDELAHVEDTDFVNAIRDGKIVQVTWNELTEEEKRAAHWNMFLSNVNY